MTGKDLKRQQMEIAVELVRQGSQSEVLVDQVMTPRPNCISAESSVLELVRLLHEREFRHPLVTDAAGRLVGVVSDRDVLRCFGPGTYPEEHRLAAIKTSEIMSTDLITLSPRTPLLTAVRMMFDYGINCLPVVEGYFPVGILTTTDLYLVLETLLQSLHPPQVESSLHSDAIQS